MLKPQSLLLFLVLLSAAFFTATCKIEPPSVDLVLPIAKAPVTLQFINSKPSGTGITASDITITIVGKDAASIVNFKKEKTFTVQTNGFLSVGLLSDAAPSTSRPYEFTVIAEAPGYLPAMQSVRIASEDPQILEVPMVRLAAPPAGVSVATGSFDATIGGTAAEFTLNTPISGGKEETATVRVPIGTILYDASGTALSGSVAATLVHFDTRSEESLASFPGGFVAADVIGTTDNAPVAFSTGGFASLEMTVGGTKVKTFNQAISIDIQISSDVKNADNGYAPIAAGDQFPVWSMDKTTGVWRMEGSSTVASVNGKLQARVSTTHLSYFNLDYYTSTCLWNCGSVTFVNGTVPFGYYRVDLYNAATNVLMKSSYQYINNNTMRFWLAPSMQCYLKVVGLGANSCYYYGTGSVVHTYATSPNFNPATSNISVNLAQPATLPPLASITINITANCTNRLVNVPSINSAVWYRPTNSYCWKYLGYVWNGRIQVSNAQVIVGQQYTFYTYYGQFDYTITGNENTYALNLQNYCN